MIFNSNDLNSSEKQIVIFSLGADELGADIMNVKEIVKISEITPVPNAPDYIEGVCNLRGRVLPIIDGRTKLHMDKKEQDEKSRVLVAYINGKLIGMIVDKVSEVIRVSPSDIELPPTTIKNSNVDGIVKLNNGKRLIMLIDMLVLLGIDEIEELGDLSHHLPNTIGNAALDITTIEQKEKIQEEQFVSFLLGKEEYALNIMQVKEIIIVPDIVKVPNCENYVDGVISFRNRVIPIFDMRKYFCMPEIEANDNTRIIVVAIGKIIAGIMVDKVLEVIRVTKDIIQPPPPIFNNTAKDQLKGIAKLNNGTRLILLLDTSKIMVTDKIRNIEGIEIEDDEEKNTSIEKQLIDEEQVVTFKLNSEEYAVKITDVQEINKMTQITKVPLAPSFFLRE